MTNYQLVRHVLEDLNLSIHDFNLAGINSKSKTTMSKKEITLAWFRQKTTGLCEEGYTDFAIKHIHKVFLKRLQNGVQYSESEIMAKLSILIKEFVVRGVPCKIVRRS